MEYKDLLDLLVKMEALVLLDQVVEGPSTAGGGRALVQKLKGRS